MRTPRLLIFLFLVFALGCGGSSPDVEEVEQLRTCECPTPLQSASLSRTSADSTPELTTISGALLASRFATLEELMEVIDIEYFRDSTATDSAGQVSSAVRITHCSNGREVVSVLKLGLSEGDIKDARDGDIWDQLDLGFTSPFTVMSRKDLQVAFILSRRRPNLYGEGDPAFFDLAQTTVENIVTKEIAFVNPRDSSEKGYLNSFNHITAQAFLTSIFSEELADFIADLHERHHMPELITGEFTPEQLIDPDKNPVDNYVDVVNNEWGQELGKWLRGKYQINRETYWTPELLTNYLNDLQSYYSWAFQIGFKPYRADDQVVTRFATKINVVKDGISLTEQ